MLIIKNAEDDRKCTSCWRNNKFVLTREEVEALLDGKTLGDPDFDEYGTFITMEDEKGEEDETR